SETLFQVLARSPGRTLVEARPRTGRTHQIRLHLVASGCPVVGDELYGRADARGLALRAVALSYVDPFTNRPIRIRAPIEEFCQGFGFAPPPRERSTADGPAPEVRRKRRVGESGPKGAVGRVPSHGESGDVVSKAPPPVSPPSPDAGTTPPRSSRSTPPGH